jgi:integrase
VRSEVTFHSLRHTATSLLKNAGVSEAVARDIIGHESAAISRHYTHIDEDSKRKALSKLPDITALPSAKKPKT